MTSQEMWPEMGSMKYGDFLQDVVDRNVEPVYEEIDGQDISRCGWC